jgi:DNA-directed RNA polymerase subunit RPC12/RpoP
MNLITVFSSNVPMDCHILKGRLESDGIRTFLFDEHIISVHPFRAVTVGGVKLKVQEADAEKAGTIMAAIRGQQLHDEDGNYDLSTALDQSMERANEVLRLKAMIRAEHTVPDHPDAIQSELLSKEEIGFLLAEERGFAAMTHMTAVISFSEFLRILFDYGKEAFRYLRPRTIDYYLEKELTELYMNDTEHESSLQCPNCGSDDVYYGHAIDYKYDIIYLILSLAVMAPLPPFRKKYHCFQCGNNFRKHVHALCL